MDEGNTGAVELSNSTAYRNGGLGFSLGSPAAVLRRNVAVGNDRGEQGLAGSAKADDNSWQEQGWSPGSFRSVDAGEAEGRRQPDGGLPGTAFLSTGTGQGASTAG